jgi:hypothetical protein
MITSLQRQKKIEDAKKRNVGITIRQVGIGDGLQFSSLPENFFAFYGHKLIDLSQPWYLDFNPYVRREGDAERVVELWNYPAQYEWPKIRSSVYMTNAEIHASILEVKHPVLNRPRLYQYEDYPFDERDTVLFHPHGRSHGSLPDEVIDHVLKKYKHCPMYQIGLPEDPSVGIPRIKTKTMWQLAEVIATCRMLIGVDSGPAWIAACYPDVLVKKIRTKFQFGYCDPKDWVAMDLNNSHSFWDDTTLFKIYNCTDRDMGFTRSFRDI